jgi:diguanylate cyclase (GGDEF)-like protein
VAAVLQATAARGGDLVARYGGEEFAVVAPATHPDSARELGERLRAAIQAIPGDVLPQMVTISVGVAGTGAPLLQSPEALLAGADVALYAAKRAGRNRVEVWEDAGRGPATAASAG